jgi:exodeoxyribonuclease III
MSVKRFLSWNVNGVRAAQKKGFLTWLKRESPYLMALQETKAWKEQLNDDLLNPPGYFTYWSKPEKKGYSGVAVLVKEEPSAVSYGFGLEKFDSEGRVIRLDYPKFTILNIYFPAGISGDERLKYKLDFNKAFYDYLGQFKNFDKPLILCGDLNTAHKEIDLARPKANEKNSGFLPEERAWLDKFVSWGLIDTFREFNKQPDNYSWWDLKSQARIRNVGWRIDYFMVNGHGRKVLKDAFILNEVYGSDHCPVGITLDI